MSNASALQGPTKTKPVDRKCACDTVITNLVRIGVELIRFSSNTLFCFLLFCVSCFLRFPAHLGDMEKWRGKGALVTGANSGIGAAITRKLLELGMIVAGLDKQTDYLNVSLSMFLIRGYNNGAAFGIGG